MITIIETPVFTGQIRALVDDDVYAAFQACLIENPESGEVIRGTGGLRKARIARPGKGKRGGARVIYYWINARGQILMLLAYAKNEQEDLTAAQKRVLKALVEQELHHE